MKKKNQEKLIIEVETIFSGYNLKTIAFANLFFLK